MDLLEFSSTFLNSSLLLVVFVGIYIIPDLLISASPINLSNTKLNIIAAVVIRPAFGGGIIVVARYPRICSKKEYLLAIGK